MRAHTALCLGLAPLLASAALVGCTAGPGEPDASPSQDPVTSVDGKQACEYWAVAKTKTIDEIGEYVLAATDAAADAAASDPSWEAFVIDLETIYPLVTQPVDDPSLMLTTSDALDTACLGYESWPGEVTPSIPNSTEVLDPDSSEEVMKGRETVDLSTITPVNVDDLTVTFPSKRELSKVAGGKFTPYKWTFTDPPFGDGFEGATSNSPRPAVTDVELSDPDCAPTGVYSDRQSPLTGELAVGNGWVETLDSTAWARMTVMESDLDSPLLSWDVNAHLADPASVVQVLTDAEKAYPGCVEATATLEVPDIAGGGTEEALIATAPPRVSMGNHTVICSLFGDAQDLVATVTFIEPVGAVLLKTRVGFNGDPLSEDLLPGAVDLYNAKADALAKAQSISRPALDTGFVSSACQDGVDAKRDQAEAAEAAKYNSAPVVYVVTTYDGGDVTLSTSTGTSQRAVSDGESVLPQRGFVPGDFLYVSVQNDSDVGVVRCEIYVDGERVSSNSSNASYGIATCEGNR